MKVIKTIIISSFVFLSVQDNIPGQPIPIKVERNRVMLPVRVGNSRVLKIILDTGMAFDGLLIYNPELKDSINLLNPVEVKVPGAGDGEPSNALMDESGMFNMDKVEFTNQKILLLQNEIYKGFPSDGVMGYSIFGHYTTEIDVENNMMRLHNTENFSVDETWESIPIYFKNNSIPWLDISVIIDNESPVPISVYIDFAAEDAIILLEKEGMKFNLPKKTEPIYLGRGLSGDIHGKKAKISQLKIGSFEMKDVVSAFAPAEVRSKQKNADGIIGGKTLKRFNLIFDYVNKKLYIKPNKFFNDPSQ